MKIEEWFKKKFREFKNDPEFQRELQLLEDVEEFCTSGKSLNVEKAMDRIMCCLNDHKDDVLF